MEEKGYTYDAVPMGTYSAEYLGCEEKQIKWKDKTGREQEGPMLEHKWSVDVDGNKVEATNLTPLRPNPKNLLGRMFRTFEGREIQPQETAFPSKWVGRKAMLVFELIKERSKIVSVLPAPR